VKIVRSITNMRHVITDWRRTGATVGLVPTMGGLHAGHLSLVRIAAERSDQVVATLFVNPAQFSPAEDFDAYPRNEDEDCRMFEEVGASLVFAPPIEEVYPAGHATKVHVEGLSSLLEGEFRPQFLTGVATVVSKLLIQVMADVAVFGEKDYQQLQVIRRMARDLNIPTEILGAPTVREHDGLAMSSRNRYLSEDERPHAGRLFSAISDIARATAEGVNPIPLCDAAERQLIESGFREVDYITVRDAETLEYHRGPGFPGRVLAAAWLGKTRLIDNVDV
tara:strand:- start:351 stop:1187 length:837 start_codon:yes stop_codon:yes gene_type:complete